MKLDTIKYFFITVLISFLGLSVSVEAFSNDPPDEDEEELVGSDPDDAAPPQIDPRFQMENEEWELVFRDEFQGDVINYEGNRWSERSSSLRDQQQGNCGENDQMEWNTFDNLEVKNGVLTMNAYRLEEPYDSGCFEYPWTGSMINSSPGITFTYAYIEERSKQPLERGMWPAFWTWQAPGATRQKEVDVYEFWSSWNEDRFLTTTHGAVPDIVTGSSWVHYSDHNTTADEWNVYGADIRPDGIHYYFNGELVNRTGCCVNEDPMNIISNLAVVEKQAHHAPPDSVVHAQKHVDYIRVWKRKDVATSTEGSEILPTKIDLEQNYPNPFNPTTVINYQLPESGAVRLDVYDMAGRQVATLVDGVVSAGRHSVQFDGSELSSGVYIYRLTFGDVILTEKLSLIK